MNIENYKTAWEVLEERIKFRPVVHGLNEEAEHAIKIMMAEIAMRYGIPPTDYKQPE